MSRSRSYQRSRALQHEETRREIADRASARDVVRLICDGLREYVDHASTRGHLDYVSMWATHRIVYASRAQHHRGRRRDQETRSADRAARALAKLKEHYGYGQMKHMVALSPRADDLLKMMEYT